MDKMRGYASVGLVSPKSGENLGGVLRAVGCYGAQLVAVQGQRFKPYRTDTQSAWKHIPLLETDDLLSVVPFGCEVVGIEIVDGSRSLESFSHPERAFYIFGPEDGSIPASILKQCEHVVSIPTRFCMNLAATANVVLYDRLAKQIRNKAMKGVQ